MQRIVAVLVPTLIFVVGLAVGAAAAARCLPELSPGPVAGMAFFLACGLIGCALALIGLHAYLVVEEVSHLPSSLQKGEVLAGGLRNAVFEVGSLMGFATVVFLLAPRPDSSTREPTPER
jgi:hypothetical protein